MIVKVTFQEQVAKFHFIILQSLQNLRCHLQTPEIFKTTKLIFKLQMSIIKISITNIIIKEKKM